MHPDQMPATEQGDYAQGFDAASAIDAAEFKRLDERIASLEDFARNVGGLDEALLTSADLNFYRETMREWIFEARRLMA